jgi:hypothetical protein
LNPGIVSVRVALCYDPLRFFPTSLTLEQLTTGRQYFIRVLARNTVGSGDFCSVSGEDCPASGTALSAYAA